MNKIEFYDEFKELCEYYNNKIYENKKITKMYYEKIKNKDIETFKRQCETIINSSKYMPKVADLSSVYGHRGREYSRSFLESLYDVGC